MAIGYIGLAMFLNYHHDQRVKSASDDANLSIASAVQLALQGLPQLRYQYGLIPFDFRPRED